MWNLLSVLWQTDKICWLFFWICVNTFCVYVSCTACSQVLDTVIWFLTLLKHLAVWAVFVFIIAVFSLHITLFSLHTPTTTDTYTSAVHFISERLQAYVLMEILKRGNSITSLNLETPELTEEDDRAATHSKTFCGADRHMEQEGWGDLRDSFHDGLRSVSVSQFYPLTVQESWPI